MKGKLVNIDKMAGHVSFISLYKSSKSTEKKLIKDSFSPDSVIKNTLNIADYSKFIKYYNNLSSTAKDAVNEWKFGDDTILNKCLSQKKCKNNLTKKKTHELKKVIKQSPPLPKSIIVFRAVSSKYIKNTINDNRFIATSLSPLRAIEYVTKFPDIVDTILKIHVPKNTRCFVFPLGVPLNKSRGIDIEYEILFVNPKLKYTKHETSLNGNKILEYKYI